jgi:hypothetical protein
MVMRLVYFSQDVESPPAQHSSVASSSHSPGAQLEVEHSVELALAALYF